MFRDERNEISSSFHMVLLVPVPLGLPEDVYKENSLFWYAVCWFSVALMEITKLVSLFLSQKVPFKNVHSFKSENNIMW